MPFPAIYVLFPLLLKIQPDYFCDSSFILSFFICFVWVSLSITHKRELKTIDVKPHRTVTGFVVNCGFKNDEVSFCLYPFNTVDQLHLRKSQRVAIQLWTEWAAMVHHLLLLGCSSEINWLKMVLHLSMDWVGILCARYLSVYLLDWLFRVSTRFPCQEEMGREKRVNCWQALGPSQYVSTFIILQ